MTGPYFITTLSADISILPVQMNNNILGNIKNNLEKRYLKKCFLDYGYIEHIYDIGDVKGGLIRPEDNTASAIYNVTFKCKICNPVKDTNIIAKITGINNMIIIAKNGPITIVIPAKNINDKNIQYKNSAFYPISSKGQIISKPIKEGTYAIIKILSKKLVHGSDIIKTLGKLESVVPDNDVDRLLKGQYKSDEDITREKLLNIDELHQSQNDDNVVADEQETNNENDEDNE